MSTRENVPIVKDFFAAMGRGDKQGLRAPVLTGSNIVPRKKTAPSGY